MLAVRCARWPPQQIPATIKELKCVLRGGRNKWSLFNLLIRWYVLKSRPFHMVRFQRREVTETISVLRPPCEALFFTKQPSELSYARRRAHLTANICGLNGLRPKPCYQHRKLEGVPVKKHKPGIALHPRRTHLNHLFLLQWTNWNLSLHPRCAHATPAASVVHIHHLGLFVPFWTT